jgi:hypothetical protein
MRFNMNICQNELNEGDRAMISRKTCSVFALPPGGPRLDNVNGMSQAQKKIEELKKIGLEAHQFGEDVEAGFIAAASKQGLLVSRPVTSMSKYDFIVDNGQQLYRIQVKGTREAKPTDKGRWRISVRHSRGFYNSSQLDFFAFYIGDLSRWYIVPVNQCKKNFRVYGDKSKAEFKEAWHLLKAQEANAA